MSGLSVSAVRARGDELQRDPIEHANHVVPLLSCIKASGQEPVVKAAIQVLKLFFITQHDSRAISVKRRRVDAPAVAAADTNDPQQAVQQQYQQWLSRQYTAFTAALLQLLRTASGASLQVAAVSALMECVRHECGPASFSNALFSRTLATMVLSPHTAPEVFALLASRYLPCWDVRYYTLRSVTRIAQQRAVRGSSTAAAAAAAAADDSGRAQGDTATAADSDEDDLSAADRKGPQLLPKSAGDVARALYDVLAAVVPIVVLPRRQQRPGEEGQEEEEEQEVPSWCGAAEAGLVTAAAAAATLSSKARRKRKQQQQTAAAPDITAVAWANRRLQQREFQEAWLAFLRTDLPGDIYKKVLLKVHSDVLPALSSPLLLSDFLTHALDRGGFEGMLALNGLFTLVTRHGLEYPGFYARLYGLITPGAFTNKHRAQFFQLADIFLASGMVPAYTAAAFAKKMARLALTAPPAGALLAIGFVHNIIRRHPACMVMLHKPTAAQPTAAAGGSNGAAANGSSDVAAGGGAGVDVYDMTEADPAKSRAVESSLWEVQALKNHYSPQVAAMCAVLDKDLSDRVRTSEVDMVPLLTASYASLLHQELGRKLRRGVPVSHYSRLPAGLFDSGVLGDDLAGWDLTA